PPACTLEVPAVSVGENGNGLEHALPLGPEVMSNVEDGVTGAPPDHGEIDATVVYEPHGPGVLNGARSPPKKCSFRSSKGSCGVSLKVETSCPVTGSGFTSPATLTSTPETGSLATR